MKAVEQIKADYYGLDCTVIDNGQPCWAKILLPSGELWVPKETLEYAEAA